MSSSTGQVTRDCVTWPIRRSRNSEEDLFVGEDYFRRKIGFRSGRVVGVDADVAAFDLDTNEEFVKDQQRRCASAATDSMLSLRMRAIRIGRWRPSKSASAC